MVMALVEESGRLSTVGSLRVLSEDENERLTRVGPGTPMGRVFRRYWIPACLAEEVPEPDGAPVRVRLLGEDLVAFRDTNGVVGLVDAYCAHRRAPLFFGRNEECGIRCVYHGWKYDTTTGQCVDLPSEPSFSRMKDHVSIAAYPTFEAAGLIWTYMGPKESTPPRPDYEWLRAPSTHVGISKTLQACNYLQAIEGGIDSAHVGFLHNEDIANPRLLASADNAPELQVDVTDYGFRYVGIRNIREHEIYVRGYQFIMPCQKLQGQYLNLFAAVPDSGDLNVEMRMDVPHIYGHLWVPLDDETTATYNLAYSIDLANELSQEWWINFETASGRGPEALIPGTYKLKQNLDNDYLIDRARQKTRTYTGIIGVNTQDVAIQEGMGPIVDRSREFLGTTDKAIIAARELLLEATNDVEQDQQPRGVDPAESRHVSAADVVFPQGTDWRQSMVAMSGSTSAW
jgi:phthalate 4,5-dioxygenase